MHEISLTVQRPNLFNHKTMLIILYIFSLHLLEIQFSVRSGTHSILSLVKNSIVNWWTN